MEMLLWFFFVGHEYNIYVKNHMICQNNASGIRQKKTALEFFLPHVQLQSVHAALKSNTYPIVPAIIIFI